MADIDHDEDQQYPDNDELIPYVTGGNLAQKRGAKVMLWGNVSEPPASDGKTFYMKTVDDQRVCVVLDRPLNERLEGWYEVYGKVQTDNCVKCDEYVRFGEELTANLDKEGHKALAKLLTALDDPWNLGDVQTENDVEPMAY